jgi:hypothetical protein
MKLRLFLSVAGLWQTFFRMKPIFRTLLINHNVKNPRKIERHERPIAIGGPTSRVRAVRLVADLANHDYAPVSFRRRKKCGLQNSRGSGSLCFKKVIDFNQESD